MALRDIPAEAAKPSKTSRSRLLDNLVACG
jgi:hypothetical protein